MHKHATFQPFAHGGYICFWRYVCKVNLSVEEVVSHKIREGVQMIELSSTKVALSLVSSLTHHNLCEEQSEKLNEPELWRVPQGNVKPSCCSSCCSCCC